MQLHYMGSSLFVDVSFRLNTDIEFGARNGMRTLLVLTGVSKKDDLGKQGTKPDYIADTVADILSCKDQL